MQVCWKAPLNFSAVSSANVKSFNTSFVFLFFLVHHHAYSGQAAAEHVLLSIMRLKHLPDPCPLGEACRIQTAGGKADYNPSLSNDGGV